MSFIAILLLGFILGDLLWWVLAHRRLKSRAGRIAAAVWVLVVLGGLGLVIAARSGGAGWEHSLPRAVLSIVFVWHLLVLPPWLVWQLARGLGSGVRRFVVPRREKAEGVSRREFLTTGATFAPAVITGGSALVAEAQLEQFRVRRIEVPLASLPPALDGLTIAHLSDTHVGRFTRGAILERIVRATNDLDADLAVLTGDLINFALRDLPAGIDLVRGLRARHGVFLCEGNHDLIENGPEFRRSVLRAGLPLLRGDAAMLDVRSARVQVLGLPWTHGNAGHARALAALAPLLREGAFPILLAHHPHAFDAADDYPLTVAGHTHGGQLMLNEQLGFGPAFFRYWSGLYRRGGRALVVSNGTGNWFPVRLAAPAEIIHLTLRRG